MINADFLFNIAPKIKDYEDIQLCFNPIKIEKKNMKKKLKYCLLRYIRNFLTNKNTHFIDQIKQYFSLQLIYYV